MHSFPITSVGYLGQAPMSLWGLLGVWVIGTGKCHWPFQAALSGSIIKAPGFAGGYLLYRTGSYAKGRQRLTVLLAARQDLFIRQAIRNVQGTEIAPRPPHRSVRAAFPHTAPTSGVGGKPAACAPAPVSRSSGSASGTCFAGSHSPWSQPFAPPTPQRIAPSCSPASQLL